MPDHDLQPGELVLYRGSVHVVLSVLGHMYRMRPVDGEDYKGVFVSLSIIERLRQSCERC